MQVQLCGHVTLSPTQLQRAPFFLSWGPALGFHSPWMQFWSYCSDVTPFELLIMFEEEATHLHFTLDSINHVASPGCTHWGEPGVWVRKHCSKLSPPSNWYRGMVVTSTADQISGVLGPDTSTIELQLAVLGIWVVSDDVTSGQKVHRPVLCVPRSLFPDLGLRWSFA